MSMWSMPSDASASRIALIMALKPAWPAPLTPRGLTVVGWSGSVTSEDGESKARGPAFVRAARQPPGSSGRRLRPKQVYLYPGRSTHEGALMLDRAAVLAREL